MEHEYGLIGGNIFHGELSPDQLFHMRPAPGYADFRTPIAGLYQASSATHGGGGVTGIPGLNATRQIMRDRATSAVATCVERSPRSRRVAFVVLARRLAPAPPAAAAHPLRLTVGTLGTHRLARSAPRRQRGRARGVEPPVPDAHRASIRRRSTRRPASRRRGRPRPDGRGWIYTLRPGLTWSDGKPVTAADVVYSLEHARDEHWPYAGDSLDGLHGARDRRPHRRGARRPRPTHAACPALLLHVVPAHVFSKVADLDTDVAALGVADGTWHVDGDDRRLGAARRGRPAANGPALQQIVFRTYPNADALIDALAAQAGRRRQRSARLRHRAARALPDVTVDHAGDGTQYVLRDRLDPTEQVRQAISLAIDRDRRSSPTRCTASAHRASSAIARASLGARRRDRSRSRIARRATRPARDCSPSATARRSSRIGRSTTRRAGAWPTCIVQALDRRRTCDARARRDLRRTTTALDPDRARDRVAHRVHGTPPVDRLHDAGRDRARRSNASRRRRRSSACSSPTRCRRSAATTSTGFLRDPQQPQPRGVRPDRRAVRRSSSRRRRRRASSSSNDDLRRRRGRSCSRCAARPSRSRRGSGGATSPSKTDDSRCRSTPR